jgi:hypothetical protein
MYMANGLKRPAWFGILALGAWAFLACQENITSEIDGDLIPINAVTVEVDIPFEAFGDDLQGWGGYGRTYELAKDVVANSFEGSLDARILNGFNPYPAFSTIRDTTGVFAADSSLTFVGAKLIAHFDTLTSIHDGAVTLSIGALARDWDFRSTNWDAAVDSVGDRQEWSEAGGGPIIPVTTAVWDPAASDSVIFDIDSAGAALFADTADAENGLRLDAVTEGVRLDLIRMTYALVTKPSVNPDTLVNLIVPSLARTFIYSPVPELPTEEIRVGGVPAWRSVFSIDVPEFLDGDPELCAKVVCPVKLTAESLISAALVLTSQAPPPAFQPTDSLLFLDVRPVLEPSRLPKSPLGPSLVGSLGVRLSPGDFQGDAGVEIEIPLGPYIEGLISAKANPDLVVPNTVALLSLFEPLSIFFVAFEGPDSPASPGLRLILTFSDEVQVR